MIRSLRAAVVALLACAVAACGPTAAERCAQAKSPTECLQVAQAGGDVNDYLLYGMAGYMLSSAINGSGQRQPVIVADPSYHGYRRPIASYRASRGHVRRTTTVTTTRRSMFGGTTTKTRTSHYRSSPYRPSSFRTSSFRSRR